MGKLKGRIHVDSDRCKGCSLCVLACPPKIIAIDATTSNSKGYYPAFVTNMDMCIACCNCAISCPDNIITVEQITTAELIPDFFIDRRTTDHQGPANLSRP